MAWGHGARTDGGEDDGDELLAKELAARLHTTDRFVGEGRQQDRAERTAHPVHAPHVECVVPLEFVLELAATVYRRQSGRGGAPMSAPASHNKGLVRLGRAARVRRWEGCSQQKQEARMPITKAAHGRTKPAHGVMVAKPAMAPTQTPTREGRLSRYQSMTIHTVRAVLPTRGRRRRGTARWTRRG